MNDDVMKKLNESLTLDKLLEQAQSNNPSEKARAQQGLAEWLSYIPYPEKLKDNNGNPILPEGLDLQGTVKKLMGVLYGKSLYRKLPEFTAGTIDELMKIDPSAAYMLSVPLLEKLGEYVGIGKIDGEDFSGTLKKIDEEKMTKEEAGEIAKQYAEKYLKPAFENDARIEPEDVEELMEIYIDIWTDGLKDKTGKMLLKKQYSDLYIEPWMSKNKDKIVEYAKSIKDTALANKRASSYEGYTKIKEYMLPVTSVMEQIKQQYQKQAAANPEMALA